MLAVNYSNMRDNFKDYCDKVTDDYETVIVTRKNDKNVVMISLEEYNNMKENLYIMSNKKDYDRLVASKKQLESGEGIVTKNMAELRKLENE
jgi:prevent-host-death family protein